MKKNYRAVILFYGAGLCLILFIIMFYSLKPSIQIKVFDDKIQCSAVKFNLNTEIPMDKIKKMEYIVSPILLYEGTELKGPLTKGQKLPRSMIMKTLGASSAGISTEQYAAGNGEIEGVGDCLVYIYWQQYSYILFTLEDDSLIALNENGDGDTKELYESIRKNVEKRITNHNESGY